MTTLILSSMMCFPLILTKNNPNPVKLSMALLLSSMMVFLCMYLCSSFTWFPLIYFLIFMGGILMMFMILSSVLPNEKSKKAKLVLFLMMIYMFIFSMDNFLNPPMTGFSNLLKSILNSSSNLTILMLLMMMYFFLTLMMVSKQENPLRTLVC